MTSARITYHVLNVLVSGVLIGVIAATAHGHRPDWFALALIVANLLNGLSSMDALRKDKP